MKSNSIRALGVVAGLALLIALYAIFQATPHVEAVGGQATYIGVATTSTAVAVTSSTRVLATTTNALGNGTSYTRMYATVCNTSSNPVYLRLDGDKRASSASATAVIAAAAGYDVCYQIRDYNQYSGSIQASSTNETSTSVLVTDYVQ